MPVPAKCQRQVPAAFAVVVVFSLPVLSVVTVLTVVYAEEPDFLSMAEVFAIRLLDALDTNGPHVRSHDGKRLITVR